ncbi:hypothetical protein BDW59DRAFT_162606 [Aspergillus cavernicola]|uniref:Uncharacterized protein n=1 Tax=Aspergillus cavernicola TaxID=176166 RepID=A0ABR4I941_9EURO
MRQHERSIFPHRILPVVSYLLVKLAPENSNSRSSFSNCLTFHIIKFASTIDTAKVPEIRQPTLYLVPSATSTSASHLAEQVEPDSNVEPPHTNANLPNHANADPRNHDDDPNADDEINSVREERKRGAQLLEFLSQVYGIISHGAEITPAADSKVRPITPPSASRSARGDTRNTSSNRQTNEERDVPNEGSDSDSGENAGMVEIRETSPRRLRTFNEWWRDAFPFERLRAVMRMEEKDGTPGDVHNRMLCHIQPGRLRDIQLLTMRDANLCRISRVSL